LRQKQHCGLGNDKFGKAAFQTDQHPIAEIDWGGIPQGTLQAIETKRDFNRKVSLAFRSACFAGQGYTSSLTKPVRGVPRSILLVSDAK
jgi:hypothetical protein